MPPNSTRSIHRRSFDYESNGLQWLWKIHRLFFQFGFFSKRSVRRRNRTNSTPHTWKKTPSMWLLFLLYRLAFIGTGYETYTRERCVRKLSYYFFTTTILLLIYTLTENEWPDWSSIRVLILQLFPELSFVSFSFSLFLFVFFSQNILHCFFL